MTTSSSARTAARSSSSARTSCIERAHALGDRVEQAGALLVLLVPLGAELHHAHVELARRFLQPLHFREKRGRALRQARRGGLRFRHAVADPIHGLASGEEAPLRRVQALVGVTLLELDARNRLARLGLARVELHALVLGTPALERELLRPAGEPNGILPGPGQLRLEADDRLLVLVQLTGDRTDRLLRRDDRLAERGHARRQSGHGFAFGRHTLAQLADFALRRQNPARLGSRAAIHEAGAPQHVAGDRRDRTAALAGRGRWPPRRIRQSTPAEGALDLAGVRSCRARHFAQAIGAPGAGAVGESAASHVRRRRARGSRSGRRYARARGAGRPARGRGCAR